MIWMPGSSHTGPLPPLAPGQAALVQSLRRDVEELAGRIGIRNTETHPQLEAAANFVERRFRDAGFTPARQTFQTDGKACHNIEVEIAGTTAPGEIVVIGAHYDSVTGCPGANDNGSGTAALIALAGVFAGEKPGRTLRFVAFTNEEPENFCTPTMGSWVYAKRCHERRENIRAMISIETIGYYTDAPNSQAYPAPLSWFYPSTGNFVAFVGNLSSRRLVRESIGVFRREAAFPSEGAALPESLDGVGWSDHWAFWQEGYPAIMVTDTAVFRYPQYHTAQDTPDRIDCERFARVVDGMKAVVRSLTGAPRP
ncbi:MAG: M28 family peptidase [Planctomycetes bacterium]|nr:M28 family peptidase [Planctomycetota bacterium]